MGQDLVLEVLRVDVNNSLTGEGREDDDVKVRFMGDRSAARGHSQMTSALRGRGVH